MHGVPRDPEQSGRLAPHGQLPRRSLGPPIDPGVHVFGLPEHRRRSPPAPYRRAAAKRLGEVGARGEEVIEAAPRLVTEQARDLREADCVAYLFALDNHLGQGLVELLDLFSRLRHCRNDTRSL